MSSRKKRTEQLCSSLCTVNNLKEESTCANDRKKDFQSCSYTFGSDVLPPITREVFYRSSEVFCTTSPAMIQERQIPNSLQVTQQYINLEFWRRIEMLHRQMSHNAKGKGKRSNFSPSRLGFVFFSSFCSFMVWGWVLFCFILIILTHFYSLVFLNIEPPRFSCSSS